MRCEICGKETDLVKAKIEGAVLNVCESCAEAGEKIETSKESKKVPKKKKSKKIPRDEEELILNFNEAVRNSREEKELSMKELANSINEKKSVIKRIEHGDLKPPKSLADKLERELDISLYEKLDTSSYESGKSSDREEVTVGDVAEVKKKN